MPIDPVRPEQLAESIRRHHPGTLWSAEQLGTDALPVIADFLADADWETRALAIACLARICGDAVEPMLADALADAHGLVRHAALTGLLAHASMASAAKLLDFYDTAANRREGAFVARIIGRHGLADTDTMIDRWRTAADDATYDSWRIALARQGHRPAQWELLALLYGAPERRVQFFELDLLEVGQDWLLKFLGPFLDDERPLIFIGHGADPESLRTCDACVRVVSSLATANVDFDASLPRHFDRDERDAIRRLLDATAWPPGWSERDLAKLLPTLR